MKKARIKFYIIILITVVLYIIIDKLTKSGIEIVFLGLSFNWLIKQYVIFMYECGKRISILATLVNKEHCAKKYVSKGATKIVPVHYLTFFTDDNKYLRLQVNIQTFERFQYNQRGQLHYRKYLWHKFFDDFVIY